MKHILILALLLCFTVIKVYAEEPFREIQFQNACEVAKKEEKIIIIDFFTTWCGPCKQMDKTTWKDPTVTAWLSEKAIAIKVDAEQEVELAERYKIKAYPTILMLKADGTEIDRLIGYRPPTEFLSEVKDSIAGKTSLIRAKESLAENKNNPSIRFKYADTLAEVGKFKEALEEYLWCYDHGLEYNKSFIGVRSSFLLNSIVRLGQNYPPALDALKERRNTLEQLLLEGKGERIEVLDFATLNRSLQESSHNLTAFDKFKQIKATKLQTYILNYVIDDLLTAHRYDDILESAPNIAQVAEQRMSFYKNIENSEKNSGATRPDSDDLLLNLRNSAIKDISKFYEALLGKNRLEEADTLANQILAFSPSKEAFSILIQRAKQAGNKERVQSLLTQALKTLPESDHPAIQKVARPNVD